jgi:FkbM family methyltransferase
MGLPLAYTLVGAMRGLLPDRAYSTLRRFGGLNRAFTNMLATTAPAGRTEVIVAGGILRGAHLLLDLATENEYWLGVYEQSLIAAVLRSCKPGMVVYDVGANIGYTALLFAKIAGPQGAVYAFEPLPENLERIAFHSSHNPAGATIHVVPCATSDQEGRETFLIHQSNAMGKLTGSADRDTTYSASMTVPSIRLDDFVFRDGHAAPDLIKMDIEGGAVKALPGSERIIAEIRPILLLELHGPEEQQVAWDLLRPHGYQLFAMQRGYPEIHSLDDMNRRWRQHAIAIAQ